MSTHHVFAAVSAQNLTPSEKLILICLANRADRNGECYPAASTLAIDTGYSKRTIHRSLASLARKKAISSKAKFIQCQKGRKQTSNRYKVLLGVTPCQRGSDTVATELKQYKQVMGGHYVTHQTLAALAG